jgi:hypothetical protein
MESMKTIFLMCALLLTGCIGERENTRVAGGDDIPNGVEPLGKHSARSRADSTDWNGFKAAPRTAPGMYDTTHVPDSVPDTAGSGKASPPPASAPVAKRSARSSADGLGYLLPLDSLAPLDTLITHIKDTLAGTVEAVHTLVKDSTRKVDSILFAPVDPAHPTAVLGVLQVTGKVTYADTGIWQAFRFSDADGDGLLAPRPGSLNRVLADLSSKLAGGVVEEKIQVLAAGADLDFNKRGDNRLLSSLFIRTLGKDTLDVVRLLDADGDSAIIDFGRDTNLVDVVEEHHAAQGSPAVTISRTTRIVAFSRDSTRNYAVRFKETRILADGGVLATHGRGADSDSTFRPGTDAAWIETHAYPSGDSLESRTRSFGVRLASTPGNFPEDKLLSIRDSVRFQKAAYSVFDFALILDAPIGDGHWTATGAAQADLTALSGAKLAFEGRASSLGMEGHVVTQDGQSLSVFFDLTGALGKHH